MEQRVLIKRLLERRFTIDELRSLCFELNVDYEALSGDNKSAKALAIVEYFEHRLQLEKLANTLQKVRPDTFMSSDLEKLVNDENMEALRKYLVTHQNIIAGAFNTDADSTRVDFRFGEADEYRADFLSSRYLPSATLIHLVTLEDPAPFTSLTTELKETLSTISDSYTWTRNHRDMMERLLYEKLGWQTPVYIRAVKLGLIAGRRDTNNVIRETYGAPFKLADSEIELISYDRLIDAARKFVSDLEQK